MSPTSEKKRDDGTCATTGVLSPKIALQKVQERDTFGSPHHAAYKHSGDGATAGPDRRKIYTIARLINCVITFGNVQHPLRSTQVYTHFRAPVLLQV